MSFYDFLGAWPESRKDQFSRASLLAIFEYYEEYEESTGEKVEFDPIAICCDWVEYGSAWDAMEQYQPEDMPVEGVEGDDLVEIQAKNEAAALAWLQDKTTVLEHDGGITIMQF